MEIHILDMIQNLRTPIGDVVVPLITRLGDAGIIWIILTVLLLIIPKTRKTGVIMLAFLNSGSYQEYVSPSILSSQIDFSYLYFFIFPLYVFPSVFSVLSTGIRNVWIKSGITIMNHTIGSQMITPVYPSHGTRVAAITIFPAISRPLEISGVM